MSGDRTSGSVTAILPQLGSRARAHSGQPVRRNSYHAGEREQRRWRATNTFSKAEHNARMRAAEMFDRSTKAKGRRNGALGHIGLEILRYMLRRRNWKTGQLDPAIDTIAAELGRARGAIVAGLARLRDHGFVDWQRRTAPVEDPDPFGPQVRQISNAYFLGLPKTAIDFVRRLTARAPIASDLDAHAHEQATQLEAMLKTLSAEELARFRAGDGTALAAALSAFGRSLDEAQNASSPGGQNPTLRGKV